MLRASRRGRFEAQWLGSLVLGGLQYMTWGKEGMTRIYVFPFCMCLPFGGLLGASRGLMGSLGVFWWPLGVSWGALGGLLGLSWGPLGAPWEPLVATWHETKTRIDFDLL